MENLSDYIAEFNEVNPEIVKGFFNKKCPNWNLLKYLNHSIKLNKGLFPNVKSSCSISFYAGLINDVDYAQYKDTYYIRYEVDPGYDHLEFIENIKKDYTLMPFKGTSDFVEIYNKDDGSFEFSIVVYIEPTPEKVIIVPSFITDSWDIINYKIRDQWMKEQPVVFEKKNSRIKILTNGIKDPHGNITATFLNYKKKGLTETITNFEDYQYKRLATNDEVLSK